MSALVLTSEDSFLSLHSMLPSDGEGWFCIRVAVSEIGFMAHMASDETLKVETAVKPSKKPNFKASS